MVIVGSEEDKRLVLFNLRRPAVIKQLIIGMKDKFYTASAKKYQADAKQTIEELIPELTLEQLKALRKTLHLKIKGMEQA